VTGGAVGGLTGLLVGLGALAIPGVGPVMLAGATCCSPATALSGWGYWSNGCGIMRLSLIVDGTDDDVRRAGEILSNGEFKVACL